MGVTMRDACARLRRHAKSDPNKRVIGRLITPSTSTGTESDFLQDARAPLPDYTAQDRGQRF